MTNRKIRMALSLLWIALGGGLLAGVLGGRRKGRRKRK